MSASQASPGSKPRPRRQRGTDRDTDPQPALHPVPSAGRIARARLAPALSILVWLLYVVTIIVTLTRADALADAGQLLTTIAFLVSVTLLTLSACLYLIARAGALPRFAAHRRVRRVALDEGVARNAVGMIALLPSRSEDPNLVRMALWSVALQEFADLRVVLLLDDDPVPSDPEAAAALWESRLLAAEIQAALQPVRDRIEEAAALVDSPATPLADATEIVMREHAALAAWLRERAAAVPDRTHVEAFFRDQVLGRLAADLEGTAGALHDARENGVEPLTAARAVQIMARLVGIVTVELSVFERKLDPALSHAPNKAMNLNSYLGLLGKTVPDTDYVLTLDADSMLLPEYCLRLVHLLEQPENARVAVAQTPYSAYRGAPTRIERLAGATTDLQHIVHQGLTAFGATFWVGANAILRRTALDDIRRVGVEDGKHVVRFISDRTAIEDTESTLEIALHGWSLVNYPERLSYSATPPDFGALVIQRRRWADGGLLILPRLHDLIVATRRSGRAMGWAERLLRVNYLGSITWVTVGLLAVLTLYPLNGQLVTVLLLLIVVPYFVEMASDLHHLGYRRRDMIGIYGLNLLLLAVNLVGTLASLSQALTGRKGRFVRTPKVDTRTAAPALFVLAPIVIVLGASAVAVRAGFTGAWGTTAFAAFTALAAAWALLRLVGIRSTIADLWLGWLNWVWVAMPPSSESVPVAHARWAAVLDDGPVDSLAVAR